MPTSSGKQIRNLFPLLPIHLSGSPDLRQAPSCLKPEWAAEWRRTGVLWEPGRHGTQVSVADHLIILAGDAKSWEVTNIPALLWLFTKHCFTESDIFPKEGAGSLWK